MRKTVTRGQNQISSNNGNPSDVEIRVVGARQADNHPRKGSSIRVEPIRSQKDINLLKKLLAGSTRDLALFTVGINTNLRASDLLSIRVGQVRNIDTGGHFTIKEKKTGKSRTITLNRSANTIIALLLSTMPDAQDDEWLFRSRKGGGRLTVSYLSQLVKQWCSDINLRGNFGSHTLRKTWGYMMRTVHGVDIPTLMTVYNHSTQRQTLQYLCIQPEEIRDCYMREV